MQNVQYNQTMAGYCFYVSAALHAVAIILSAGALLGVFLLPFILWAAIGYGLIHRGWRWLTYVGFIGALIGIVASVAIASDFTGLTRLSIVAITLVDIAVAYFLFRALWSSVERA